jgi:predicted glutamine amidotransferase
MCRFVLYLGPRTRLSSLIVEPGHSLIRQSVHSREREEPLNGDGFGVGWYAKELSAEPAVFRSITPAWNNRNLQNLARVVASDCVLAHVRAATQSSGVNEANCHPFRWRRYLCMHNGDIGDFRLVRRKLLASVCDEAFQNVYGSTDSEHFFALYIDSWLALDDDDPARRMARALKLAIERALILVREAGAGSPSYMNVAIADGDHAVVSRFTDDSEAAPESLYWFAGSLYPGLSDAQAPSARHAVTVSSERLTADAGWAEVPPGEIIILRREREPEFLTVAAAAARR